MGDCDPWDAENNERFGTGMMEEWRDIPNFEGSMEMVCEKWL